MTNHILLPFHQDERLSNSSIMLPSSAEPAMVDPALPEAGRWARLVTLYDALAERIAASIAAGPLRVVTGDCLAAVGTLVGLQRAGLDPSIVWFDAHGDLHTRESSESGYLGGLPLRMALGGDPDLLGQPLGLTPLAEDRVTLVDARDLDPVEERYLAGSQITHTTVERVSTAALPDGPILLHVDVDVIDAREVPGLRFPAPDGPTCSQVVAALERVVISERVVALEVACSWRVPPQQQANQQCAQVLAALLSIDLG